MTTPEGTETADGCQSTAADYLHILKQYWGYDDFRGIQR